MIDRKKTLDLIYLAMGLNFDTESMRPVNVWGKDKEITEN